MATPRPSFVINVNIWLTPQPHVFTIFHHLAKHLLLDTVHWGEGEKSSICFIKLRVTLIFYTGSDMPLQHYFLVYSDHISQLGGTTGSFSRSVSPAVAISDISERTHDSGHLTGETLHMALDT